MNYNLIEKDLLDCVCKFLEPFEEVIVNLSEEQRPTLHKVIPLRQTLINSCVVEANDLANDSNGIIQLKVFLVRRLNNAWPISDEHRLATILHPKFKKFECSPDEKGKSINVLKSQFQKHQTIISPSCTNSLVSNRGGTLTLFCFNKVK
ncbi:unnamed protein product [Rotaria magnacalcarata]|uniref:Uncharacterized protein n=2 Tax=Rotaria magnacalcarata TaxID=392030 RepID=A0A820NIF7_9BILA|nr:unnamed protein product [Rotaria magnacalcarata]